ncbi:hypothetical protein D3C87_1103140 [compost metagenome]
MRVQLLAEDSFQVVAIMTGDKCPAVDFLSAGEKATAASRKGLLRMIEHIAEHGLGGLPVAWSHEVNKDEGIYELVKGDLRLFFFKGKDRQITVLTSGIMKKGRKVDALSVARAIALKKEYLSAQQRNLLKVIDP